MRQGLQDDVSKVVENELNEITQTFPMYHSGHEGIAILFKEVREAQKELITAKTYLKHAWNDIKKNTNPKATIAEIGKFAKLLACEAVQIAAVCQKFIKSSEVWK